MILNVVIVIAAIAIVLVLFQQLGGTMSDSGSSSSTASAAVQKIAQAIALAEGFYVSGSRPARNHNPGDMTVDLIGRSTGMDGAFVVYANDADGWNNLYAQINLWLSGGSSHATGDSTISEIASFYTTTDQAAWATTVANSLGVSLDTSINEVS